MLNAKRTAVGSCLYCCGFWVDFVPCSFLGPGFPETGYGLSKFASVPLVPCVVSSGLWLCVLCCLALGFRYLQL